MSRITVDDLITQVRSLMAETNRESLTDDTDILPALNRAQDFGADVLVRHYPDPLLYHTELTLTAGQQEYDIPEDAMEQRLEKVENRINNLFYPVQKINYTDVSMYETGSSKSIPLYWCTTGQKYRILPNPINTYPIRIWYMKEPLPLVTNQGRINIINVASNYMYVDTVGSDLSTESDQLSSYVNVIDGGSGLLKATLQIQNIQGNKVTFKTTPIRTTVIDRTVVGAIPTTISEDDYLCSVTGTCVPFMKKPFSNFLVQYAVGELKRKFGETDAALEEQVLKKFEAQIESQWSGRSNAFRIQNRSNNWPMPNTRRLVITQG
jgi:hypothetical protein